MYFNELKKSLDSSIVTAGWARSGIYVTVFLTQCTPVCDHGRPSHSKKFCGTRDKNITLKPVM
jgi:hypothetical protein